MKDKKPQIEMISVEKLIPYAKNPRKNDQAVAGVMASIKEFGFQNPIIIDKENVIIAGHTRLQAAQRLELEEVPCLRAEGLTETQIKAYRLLDNKLGEKAEWKPDLLELELAELAEFGFDVARFDVEFDGIEGLPSEEKEEKELNYKEQFGVIVVCDDEESQEATYNKLLELGYNCKVVCV